MSRRHEWFREGARTFRAAQRLLGKEHLLPSDEDWYACPVCLKYLFLVSALDEVEKRLTEEHAPPESLGGRELALTCWWCNTTSGRTFDASAIGQERTRLFERGDSGEGMRAGFNLDGVTIRGNVYLAGTTGVLMVGVPQANNKADVERFEQALDAYVGDSSGLRLEVVPRDHKYAHSRDLARISWIRSAYVVAFAAFGWRYILQPSLNPIRAQFQDPDTITLPVLGMIEPSAAASRREVMIVDEPAECRSVVVRIAQRTIFLPAIDSTRTVADLAESLAAYKPSANGLVHFDFSGWHVPWPTKPMYALDQP